MKVPQAVDLHLRYPLADSKKYLLGMGEVPANFASQFKNRDSASVSQEEVLDVLLRLTRDGRKVNLE